jgi:hypothetical protein
MKVKFMTLVNFPDELDARIKSALSLLLEHE